MILKYVLTVIAVLIITVTCAWIARQCWIDSKDDFKMIWREIRRKKRKAD